jgi:spermidine/putrescine-binding protein
LLGKLPDKEVALKTGRSLTAISLKRHKLGIPTRAIIPRYTPGDLRLLGTMPDEELARKLIRHRRNKLGIANFTTEQNKWTAEVDSWLGKFTDREVAGRIGYHPGAIAFRRELLGIAAPPWGKKNKKNIAVNAP